MFPAKKKPDMSLILGIGKKPAPEQAPPAPGVKSAPPAATPPVDSQEQGEKIAAEKALVSHVDENCGNCTNYHDDSGECDAVDGQFQPDDRCWATYSAKVTNADELPMESPQSLEPPSNAA